MKIIKSFITITLSSLLLLSCIDESPFADESFKGDGKIKLNINSDNDVESTVPTVRSVASNIVVPPTEEFQIRMSSSDGSFNKLWTSLKEFEKENGFSAGNYILEAFYGTPESQGVVKEEEKGHEHSYFYGKSENISIENGKETSVSLTAKLANAVVIIEYSEAFKHYFKDWTTELITRGSSSLNIGNSEGMCYVVPGDIEVVITAAQQNGKALKLNPAKFEAEAQHLYKIKYDIYNGEVGQVDKLVLTFNDDMDDTHNISIDLTEELFNGKAPVITSDGFEMGSNIELSDYDNKTLKFVVSASGGIESAILSLKSDTFNPEYLIDGSLDLCKLTEQQRVQLEEQSGIKILGFTGKTDRMAQVDLSGFYKNLVRGDHTISLLVKDKYKRSSDNASITISRPIEIMVEAGEDPIMYGEDEGEVIIYYNGPSPLEQEGKAFTLKYANDLGQWDEVEILSINDEAYTRALDTKAYKYRIKLPNEAKRDDFHVRVFYHHNTKEVGEVELSRIYFHNIEYDAMATKLRFRFEDENQFETYKDKITVYLNGVAVVKERVSYDAESKIFTVTGLESTETSGTDYVVQTSVEVEKTSDINKHLYFSKKLSITTEAQLPVPNGDFEDTPTINIPEINIGGEYIISVLFFSGDYQNYSSINISEPKDWSSINQYTCYENSLNPNTWYLVPSTYVENKICTIRTVGFNPNGKPILKSDNGSSTNYYCTNVPNKTDLFIKAGELFLGTYNYDGRDEDKHYGIEFKSRPTSISFDYSHMGFNEEKGYLNVILKSNNGEIILNKEIDLESTVNGWDFQESIMTNPQKHLDIDLDKYLFNVKANTIEVVFKSSNLDNPDIYIPTGEQLKEDGINSGNFTIRNNRIIPANKYHSYSKGSVLKISNLKFGYE